METIKHLVLASEAFRVLVPDPHIPNSVYVSMEKHAIRTASIARVLPVEQVLSDIAVISALLHDIGSLLLASSMPNEFCAIRSRAIERKCKQFEAKEEIRGTSHAEIGAYLLGLWGVPNIAVEAIAHRHHPTRTSHSCLDCTVAVYLADLLAHEQEAHQQGTTGLALEESDRVCLETLGMLSSFAEFRELALQCHV